ncbi:MAG: hypothetical protein ACPGVG_08720 [Mycobacterium sp.]
MTTNNETKRVAQLVRDAKPVPVGTLLGNGTFRMVVTDHGYYDMDLNRSDEPKPGFDLMYEGDIVKHDSARQRVTFVRDRRGGKVWTNMHPSSIRAVMVLTGDVSG